MLVAKHLQTTSRDGATRTIQNSCLNYGTGPDPLSWTPNPSGSKESTIPVSTMLDTAHRPCFFCGRADRPLTEEHVWPKWVSRLLFGRYNSGHFRHLRATGGNTTANWTSRYFDVTTKTVCFDCNSQWLSRFENRIKSLASRLISGDGVVALALGLESQSLLAAWAYKMAMLVEVSNPDTSTEFFTPADRLRFRQTTSANEFVRVFLSRYDFGHRPAHVTTPRHTFTEKTGAQRAFYLKISTITAGYLAMQVMSVRSVESNELVPASEIEFEFCGLAREAVIPIWPPGLEHLAWPPVHTMSHQEVEDWTSMWIRPHVGAGGACTKHALPGSGE